MHLRTRRTFVALFVFRGLVANLPPYATLNIFVYYYNRAELLRRTRRFFPIGGRTITSTHCTCPRRDGQAEWPGV